MAEAPIAVSLAAEHLQDIDGIYLAPSIPSEKLQRAMKKFSQQADPEDAPIGVIDTAAFGCPADGVAIFVNYIIYVDSGNVRRYSYTDLKNPPAKKSDQKVKAGGHKLRLDSAFKAEAFATFLRNVCENM